MSLFSSAVKKPITTALIFVAIAIFGLFSFITLPIDLFPHIESNSIMVMTSYAGASASDIENNISKPLENTLNSVSYLKHISSQSRENVSVVTLEFQYGRDIETATNDVRDKLEMVKSYLPDGAGNPVIFKFGSDDIPILILSVTAKESMPGLYKIMDETIVNELARVNGVGSVSVSGIPKREIMVLCDPYKLDAYNLTIEAIASLIGSENRNIPAGTIELGSNAYAMRVQKEFNSSSEIEDLVVGSYNGGNVYLKDVARVVDGLQERSQESFINGKLGGMVIIQKQTGENSVQIVRKVKEERTESYSVNDFFRAVALGLSNPASIVVIFTLFTFFDIDLGQRDFHVIPILLAVALGSATYWFFFTLLFSKLRKKFNVGVLLWINRLLGAVVMILGVVLLGQGLIRVLFP